MTKTTTENLKTDTHIGTEKNKIKYGKNINYLFIFFMYYASMYMYYI